MSIVRRQLLIKALKLFDLLVMTAAFVVAAMPVSQGGEASFAEFLSMRIKVENFILFFGFLALWHILLISMQVYESQRLVSRGDEAIRILPGNLARNVVHNRTVNLLFRQDGNSDLPAGVLAG
ncbi:MAG: hypothetical protein ABSH52_10060 [Terriglobia bacterium]|jgi:uncharacterized membrane protein